MMKRYLVGLLIAATLAIFLLLRVDRAALADVLAGADWLLLLSAMALKVVAIKLKSQRWGLAIEAGSGVRANRRIFSATVVGLAFNLVLPARMGELARVRLLDRHNDVPVGYMASAAAVAYLLDAVLLSLFFVVIGRGMVTAEIAAHANIVAAVTLLVAIAAAVVGRRFRHDRPSRLRGLVMREAPTWVTVPLVRHSRGLLQGFAVLSQRRSLPVLLGATLLIAGAEIIAIHLGLRALAIQVDWTVAIVLVIALQLSYAIPLTPGNLGPHQLICVVVLAIFGVTMESALGFSIAFQGVAHLTVLTMAGVVLALECWHADPWRRSPAPSADST